MAFKKKITEEVKPVNPFGSFDYKGFKILVEPHELGARVILLTSWGTVATQEYGEREEAIEKVKAYAE